MIRTIRKYQKSMFGVLIFFGACFLMTSFGVDFRNHERETYAIKIDDTTIRHDAFASERRELENRYRQMFGKNYEKVKESLGLNINQMTSDKLIGDTLINRQATNLGLKVGDEELRTAINQQFPNGYDHQMYESYLRSAGMTSQEFLNTMSRELLRDQFIGLLTDASSVSKREAENRLKVNESEFGVSYVEFDPTKFVASVQAPTAEAIDSYWKDHSEEYELPARASYEYVTFGPSDFENTIQIADEDIQQYYVDNESKFQNPPQAKVSHIQLNFPKESDPKKMADIKSKAEEILAKAKAGESFSSLVLQYSEDFASRANNGDLGWIPRGKMPPSFDEEVFKMKDGGIAELIATDYGYHIAKVEALKEAEAKKLDDVKGEIVKVLKDEQAPAYASAKAQELYDSWVTTDTPLSEAAGKLGLKVKNSGGLVDATKDPEPSLAGLSKKVVEASFEPRQLISIKDLSVIVEVKEAKDPEVPELAAVRDKVIAKIKENDSWRLAEKAAGDLVVAVKEKKAPTLEAAAKAAKFEVKKKDAMKRSGAKDPIFSDEELSDSIFLASAPLIAPKKAYKVGSKFYVAQVTEIKAPTEDKIKEKLYQYRADETKSASQTLVASYISALRADAKLDIDKSLLVAEE